MTRGLQEFMQTNPWALSVSSAVFLAMMVWCGGTVDWDLGASVGYGIRRAPLWLLLVLGAPLFGAGVIVGIVRQWRLAHAPPAVVREPSPQAEQLRRDGPGWLSRGRR